MFKRIIAIAELSATSNAFIEDCEKLKVFGVEECLLIQPLIAMDSMTLDYSGIFSALEQGLDAQKTALEKHGFRVEARLLAGITIQDIANIATEEKYSLIVVGATQRSFAGEIFLGGLSAEIIHQNKVPVLVMRIEDEQDQDRPVPKMTYGLHDHVLFPTDFSDNAEQAFPYVANLDEAGAKKITVLHVQEKARVNGYSKEQRLVFDKKDMERMLAMKEMLQKAGKADVDIALLEGSATASILHVIQSKGVRLVVMGSQGRDYMKEIFLGSVSHNIARHAACSVLLIPKMV